ncbi:MAG TPA: RNA polymerase sigma factor [Patescibacteria group bacterium]|nr:RNA polymerase sigma factor [Patescibacteria group bacterium]
MTQKTKVSQYTDQTDEELFLLVQKQDEDAYRALYRRYSKRLFAYCLRVVGRRDIAEDAFQTIAMIIYEKRDSFTGGSFASWLFTIARHTCIKASQRQQHTTAMTTVLEDNDTLPANNSENSDVFMSEALQKAIVKLQPEFREALELRYMNELSYDEIAAALGISLSLAKVRVFRAKQMLQGLLKPYINEL